MAPVWYQMMFEISDFPLPFASNQESAEWEQKAREWIEVVGGFKLGNDTLQKELKSGVALCKYVTM